VGCPDGIEGCGGLPQRRADENSPIPPEIERFKPDQDILFPEAAKMSMINIVGQ